MQKVRVLIVEDELIVAEGLRIMLGQLGYEVAAIFTSGQETLENFKTGMADILFMDIHLGTKMNGVETAKELKKIAPIPVIYITNNQDERLRKTAIYDPNTVHYLTKPYSKQDIAIAIDFAIKRLKTSEFLARQTEEKAYLVNDSIFLKNGLGYKKIMIADIKFLEADGSYCKFTFSDDRTQVFSENLRYFGEKFSFARELQRVHRSYIVNINFIERIHENRIWIAGFEIPIGSTYKNELINRFRFI